MSVDKLAQENARLREELARTAAERDCYRDAIAAQMTEAW